MIQKKFGKYHKILFALLFIIIFLNSFVSALSVQSNNTYTINKISNIQIPFIENNGQIKGNSIRFYAEIFSGEVFITDKGEIVYNLIQESPAELKKALVLKETLVNSKNTGIRGINQAETNINYFIGNQEDWRTNIKSWNEIGSSEIYNNIDIKLKAYGKNIEKIFTIHNKGYVKNIKLRIEGADKISVNKNKELELKTEIGTVNFKKPYAYQIINGKKIEVNVNYKIIDSSEFIYGFSVGK